MTTIKEEKKERIVPEKKEKIVPEKKERIEPEKKEPVIDRLTTMVVEIDKDEKTGKDLQMTGGNTIDFLENF